MKVLTPVSLILLVAAFLVPANAQADGTFVIPQPVWDKHKDINEPTQKAIIVYDGGREDLILQVKYTGPVRDFGWLIPVPNLPTVRKGSMKCFYELSQITQPEFGSPLQMDNGLRLHWGWGLQSATAAAATLPPPVKVVETKTAGAYKIAVLSANDSGGLKQWLADNHFYFPPEKADVTDSYIQKHWYFIAVKIRPGGRLLGFMSTSARLASGELNPLQISFASDHCVFPLKISSVNGKPSEVGVYVLSPQPLVEKGILEKKLSEANGNDARPDGLYMHLDGADLSDCNQWIPRLADKSWWLLKQTWTFKPEEMRDLQFDPALHVFTDMLGTCYGRFAAMSLTQFGQDANSTILAAMQSTNPTVRMSASGVFNDGRGYGLDPYDSNRDRMFANAALKWLNDPEPAVRRAGIELLTSGSTMELEQAREIINMLGDENADVRQAAVNGLQQFSGMTNHFMSVFSELLARNPRAQASVLHLLRNQQVTLPRKVLVSLLSSRDMETLDAAWTQLQVQGEKLSDDDASPLLENRLPAARCLALDVLAENPGKRSVELAMSSYLHDPDQFVRIRASQSLQLLTGQHFTQDQPNEWTLWWDANKENF
jgi:Uncharacterized protein conserved in bacteria (DUF2330)